MSPGAPKRILFAGLLFFPAALQPQMPPPPARLVISSQPEGAIITINNKPMSQRTDAIFIVSPGPYTVSVASPDKNVNCGDRSVTVSAGETRKMNCVGTVWEQ